LKLQLQLKTKLQCSKFDFQVQLEVGVVVEVHVCTSNLKNFTLQNNKLGQDMQHAGQVRLGKGPKTVALHL
jgi:hypothetical protein